MFRSKWLRVLLLTIPLILVALLWKAARQRPRFVATPAPVQSLALSHDGKRLAIETDDRQIWWSEGREFQLVPAGRNYSANDVTLQFSRDGRTLFGANIRAANPNLLLARAWDLSVPKLSWSQAIEGYDGADNRLVFSPDGRKLALLSYNVVKVLDVTETQAPEFPTLMRVKLTRPRQKSGKFTALLGQYRPTQIVWTADGAQVIVMDHVERLQFWNVAKKQLVSRSSPAPLRGGGATLAASPDGRFVALCEMDGLAIWNVTSQTWKHIPLKRGAPRALAWMPDSRSLWLNIGASTNRPEGETRQLSIPDLKTLRTLPTSGPVAVSGDGQTLATRAYTTQKGVWLWNIS